MDNLIQAKERTQSNPRIFVLDPARLVHKRLLVPLLVWLVLALAFLIIVNLHISAFAFTMSVWLVVIPGIYTSRYLIGEGERHTLLVDRSGLKFGWQGKRKYFDFKPPDWSTPSIANLKSIEVTEVHSISGELKRQVQLLFSLSAASVPTLCSCSLIWFFLSKTGFQMDTDGLAFKLTLDVNVMGHWNDEERLIQTLLELKPDVPLIGHDSFDSTVTALWLQDYNSGEHAKEPLKQGVLLHNQSYEVIRKVATGGQANIYEAACTATGEQCILKEFILPRGTKQDIQERLAEHIEEEVALLNKLQDPRVVKLKEFFVDGQRVYLALEKIEGSSLRSLVKESGPLPPDKVLDLAKQMNAILAYLHAQVPPVVHRDFTPENLMLDNDGILKIVDFSVAEELESVATRTFVGKNSYVPPEQFRGKATEQSDLYAMGATLYFLLTGRDPEALSCSTPPPEAGPELCSLIPRLTALKAEERPTSIDEAAISQ